MFHQDRSRLNRENVVLTKEINELRRKAKALALQQSTVDKVSVLYRNICVVDHLHVTRLGR